jgi:hypothetical protein
MRNSNWIGSEGSAGVWSSFADETRKYAPIFSTVTFSTRDWSSNRRTIRIMKSQDAQLRELESRLYEACGVLNLAHARLVELTVKLISTELWRGYAPHWRDFLITGNADSIDGLRFTDNRGNPVTVGQQHPPDVPLPSPPPGHQYVHPVGAPVQHRWVHFTPPSRDGIPQKGIPPVTASTSPVM